MKANIITEDEIVNLKIASLPARPTAPTAYGGKGYTAKEMREAFDKLSLLIIERYNMLIDDIQAEGEDSIANSIQLGSGISLMQFVLAFAEGSALAYIPMGDISLYQYLLRMRNDLDECMSALGIGE